MDGMLAKKTVGASLEIVGTIVASDWDRKGNVKGVNILSTEGEEILVADNEVSKELRRFGRKKLKIQGLSWLSRYGSRWIEVTQFCELTP